MAYILSCYGLIRSVARGCISLTLTDFFGHSQVRSIIGSIFIHSGSKLVLSSSYFAVSNGYGGGAALALKRNLYM